MAIYTKKGDRGETSLFKGSRVPKNSLRIRVIGAIDEVNSYLGVIISESLEIKKEISEIQRNLFTIGSILAGAPLRFPKVKTKKLERELDRLEGTLPVLKNFILPSGEKVAAKLFFARTLVRRAEREVALLNSKEPLKPEILVYINRLSDYLFMVGRRENFKKGIKEEVWKAHS
jgi:cob(I)alamin adenosyltransferase